MKVCTSGRAARRPPRCSDARRSSWLRLSPTRGCACHLLRFTHVAKAASGAIDLDSLNAGDAEETGPAQRTEFQTTFARLRAILFFTFSMAVAVPLFLFMLAQAPLVALFDKFRRRWQHAVNKLWARVSMTPFNHVEIEGEENIPDDSVPAVYVANHESYMDIFSLFHLGKDFKFVSKPSIFLIPFVGWSMFLTGHIALDREDAAGFKQFIARGRELLANGGSICVFPEGTRSKSGKLATFKRGAFTIATKAQATVVPMTILGSGNVMPSGKEGELHPGRIKIIVHPPISTVGLKTADLAVQCRDVIASRMPAWKVQWLYKQKIADAQKRSI